MINYSAGNLSSAVLGQITFAAVVVVLLLVLQEPLLTSVTIACLLLLIVRFTLLQAKSLRLFELDRPRTKNLGASLFIILILLQAGQLGVLNAMVNTLMSGAALWWFTLPSHKLEPNHSVLAFDNHLAPRYIGACQNLFLCLLFLIAVAFIYQQSLTDSVLYFALVVLNIIALLFITSPQLSLKLNLKLAAFPLIIALPLAGAMFLIFPNLPPFWKLPEQQQAKTGLSEQMTPGDISDLAQTNRLAFRAEFLSGQTPTMVEMYWRVFTMESFDGETWGVAKPRQQQSIRKLPSVNVNQLSYSVVLEATQQSWLVSYQNSYTDEPLVAHRADNTLWYRKPLVKKTRYIANVHNTEAQQTLSAWELETNSQVTQPSRRIRNLIDELSDGYSPTIERNRFAQAILSYFQNQNFEYTLTPPRLSGHHMEDFLFNSQQGFCAHYAGAFTILMREAGIPARIVTGYHGGEFNSQGNYYQVYDSQAHAWAEYWQVEPSGMGRWVMVDPTSVLSPQRLFAGRNPFLSEEQTLITEPLNYMKSIEWLNQVRQYFMSLDYYWTVWILDFDQKQRLEIFEKLKQVEVNWVQLLIKLGGFMLFVAALYKAFEKVNYYRNTTYQQRALKRLQQNCEKEIRAANLTESAKMASHETITEYICRIITLLPQHAKRLAVIQKDLEYLNYANLSKTERLDHEKRLDASLKSWSKRSKFRI